MDVDKVELNFELRSFDQDGKGNKQTYSARLPIDNTFLRVREGLFEFLKVGYR